MSATWGVKKLLTKFFWFVAALFFSTAAVAKTEYRAEYGGLYITAPDQAGINQEIGWLVSNGAVRSDITVSMQAAE